jgi:hypothetical protein
MRTRLTKYQKKPLKTLNSPHTSNTINQDSNKNNYNIHCDPNPCDDYFVLSSKNLIGQTMTIRDARGKIITELKILIEQQRIHTQNWALGLYSIVVENNPTIRTQIIRI